MEDAAEQKEKDTMLRNINNESEINKAVRKGTATLFTITNPATIALIPSDIFKKRFAQAAASYHADNVEACLKAATDLGHDAFKSAGAKTQKEFTGDLRSKVGELREC